MDPARESNKKGQRRFYCITRTPLLSTTTVVLLVDVDNSVLLLFKSCSVQKQLFKTLFVPPRSDTNGPCTTLTMRMELKMPQRCSKPLPNTPTAQAI